jgi:hypothetical protein
VLRREAARSDSISGMILATPRPHRVLLIVLVCLAVATLAVGAVGVLGYCSVFGCRLFSEDFEPQGEEAARARAVAGTAVADLAGRASVVGVVVADARRDGCRSGQNNWKVKDTYSHECRVEASRVVVLTTDHGAVGAGLTRADEVIRGLGCTPTGGPGTGGLEGVRAEYWRQDNPQVARLGPSGLPGASYGCPGGRTLDVQPTSRRASATSARVLVGSGVFLDDVLEDDWYTPEDLRGLRESRAELALVVTAGDDYYRTRF